MMVALHARQQTFNKLGLAWYGGRTPKLSTVKKRMSDALDIAADVIAQIEAPAIVPTIGGSSEHADALNRGSLAGLKLQIRTVELVDAQLDALGADIDVKLLRAGNEAARDLTKLAVRVAEGAFKAQQGNTLVALLDALKASQPGRDPVDAQAVPGCDPGKSLPPPDDGGKASQPGKDPVG